MFVNGLVMSQPLNLLKVYFLSSVSLQFPFISQTMKTNLKRLETIKAVKMLAAYG